jgi:hypothetical protein
VIGSRLDGGVVETDFLFRERVAEVDVCAVGALPASAGMH